MNIEKIQQLNITVLFKDQLALVLPQNVFDTLGMTPDQTGVNVIQGPGILIINFSEQKKEFIFERNRVLINDNAGIIDKSEIIDDYFRVMQMSSFNKSNVIAYGFNYSAIASKKEGINFPEFIDESIKKNIPDKLESAAIKLIFKKENITYDLQIVPAGVASQAIIHLHFNMPVSELSEEADNLKNKFNGFFKEFKNIIEKL